jgi:cation diffusion facilitator CzcD-associated flavoprotein CzcO
LAYLQEYSAGMRLRLGTRVHRIDRTDGGWELVLDRGSLTAAHVVIATGSDAEPFLPDWPGLDSFGGTVIHAGQFRNVAEAAGRDVLVVGPGNSGVDLLGYLAASDAGRLWLSARSGMTVTPRRLGGVPLHPVSLTLRRLPVRWQDAAARAVQRLAFGDLGRFGYPQPALGPFTRQRSDGVTIAVDNGFARALRAGRVVMKPGIDRFGGPLVRFTDGTSCAPHTVICATGYRPGIEALAGHLVTVDRRGMPAFTGAPGLVVLRPGQQHLRQHARPPAPGPPAGPGHHRVTAGQRCSVPGHAAVDGQRDAGDVGRGGAGQEHHHRVNLMLLAHAPEG